MSTNFLVECEKNYKKHNHIICQVLKMLKKKKKQTRSQGVKFRKLEIFQSDEMQHALNQTGDLSEVYPASHAIIAEICSSQPPWKDNYD